MLVAETKRARPSLKETARPDCQHGRALGVSGKPPRDTARQRRRVVRESTANRNRTTTKELAMNLPGLITVHPDQTDELDALAAMVGTCFREEM